MDSTVSHDTVGARGLARRVAIGIVGVAIVAGAGALVGRADFAQDDAPTIALDRHGDVTPEDALDFRARFPTLWFDPNGPVLTWIGIVVVLMLTLQASPFASLRNIDAIMLAGSALALALRENQTSIWLGQTEYAAQTLAHVWLAIAAGYFLLRGLGLLRLRVAVAAPLAVSTSAAGILALGLTILAFARVSVASNTPAARDGLIGGIVTAETGRLPYGQIDSNDSRSPLLYALYAGSWKAAHLDAVPLLPGAGVSQRDATTWAPVIDWGMFPDARPIRIVNYALLTLLLGAAYIIGQRLHSGAMGVCLIALVCAFPGATECFARPDIMLAAALMGWSLAMAVMPGVGGLLGTLLLVGAGLAWPWAWLALPAMVVYFLRRRWEGVGSLVGLIAGIAAIVYALPQVITPALPSPERSLAHVGRAPKFSASLENERLIVTPAEPKQIPAPQFNAFIWRPLLMVDDGIALRASAVEPTPIALPEGQAAIPYGDIAADGTAKDALKRLYRKSVTESSRATQTIAALRTLIECTWLGAGGAESAGCWDFWASRNLPGADQLTPIRRAVKLAAGLIGLIAALAFMLSRPHGLQNLIGALLAVSAAAMLASDGGAATEWVWIMPALAATLTFERGRPRQPPTPPVVLERLRDSRPSPPPTSITTPGSSLSTAIPAESALPRPPTLAPVGASGSGLFSGSPRISVE
ncbi:MAG: hypothetical protein U1D55_05960 [Phycisphaerae bacterium]